MRNPADFKPFLFIASMVFCYCLFLKGFFPVKSGLEGYANLSDYAFPEKDGVVTSTLPTATFDKLVIVVIDALRADFVFSPDSEMKFTKNKLNTKHGVHFVARTQPPTVTLPRIKAITTGGIPGFIDVALNFGSPALLEDNLISQMRQAGKRIIFFGDDTWIRLFPDDFVRSDGTTSFFVTDYTEVDNNVTRHLDGELINDDWDVMILHYLGLDHIGHLAGPKSSLISPKLKEMDGVIEKIYTALKDESSTRESLIVLCGDHGMSDQGSHGGATEHEIMIPLVFLTPTAQNEISEGRSEVQQIDVVSTLSILFGLPIPRNNLGVVIEKLLWKLDLESKVRAFQINAYQLVLILQQNCPDISRDNGYMMYQEVLKKHTQWLTVMKETLPEEAWKEIGGSLIVEYTVAMEAVQSTLSSSLVKYDLHAMTVGMIGLWMILFVICLRRISLGDEVVLTDVNATAFMFICLVTLFCHTVACTSQNRSDLLCQWSFLSLLVTSFVALIFTFLLRECLALLSVISRKCFVPKCDILTWAFVFGTVIHTLGLLSSSFVEEEHQLWYYFTVTIHLLILYICAKNQFNIDLESTYSDAKIVEKLTNSGTVPSANDMYTEVSRTERKKDLRMVSKNIREKIATFQWQKLLSFTVVLILHRVSRTLNQTGNKWINELDSGDWLVRPENKMLLSLVVLASLLVIFITRYKMQCLTVNVLVIVGLCSVYCFRAAQGTVYMPVIYLIAQKGILEARIAYAVIFIIILKSLYARNTLTRFEEILSAWILLMTLILRVHNVCLVAMLSLMESVVQKCFITQISITTEALTYYCLWMANAAFFYQGNSNSMSTVDVSAGFTGVQEYWPVVIGFLMCVSTYAGPIFWLIALMKYQYIQSVLSNTKQKITRLGQRCSIISQTLLFTRALPLSIYTVLVTLLRYHLFVWTVFSPKLLYEGMLTVVLCIFIMICIMVFHQ